MDIKMHQDSTLPHPWVVEVPLCPQTKGRLAKRKDISIIGIVSTDKPTENSGSGDV